MTLDLGDVERKALAATPGPWRNGYDPSHFGAPEVTDGKTFAYYVPEVADAAYIAAASPVVVLAMIERIRRLETELARAAGIAQAHGEDAYAEDFMRVAQDRDDFDEQVRS